MVQIRGNFGKLILIHTAHLDHSLGSIMLKFSGGLYLVTLMNIRVTKQGLRAWGLNLFLFKIASDDSTSWN
ncbi:hypothetical protein ACJX0J_041474, partial [Zea mays]